MDQIPDDEDTRTTNSDNNLELQSPGVQLTHALEPLSELPASTNGEQSSEEESSKDNQRKRKRESSSRSPSKSKKQIMNGPRETPGPEQIPDQIEPFDQATAFCDSPKKKRKEAKMKRKEEKMKRKEKKMKEKKNKMVRKENRKKRKAAKTKRKEAKEKLKESMHHRDTPSPGQQKRDESKTKEDEINLVAEKSREAKLDQNSGEPPKKLKLCRLYSSSQPKTPEAAVLELPIQPTPNDDETLIDHHGRDELPEPPGKQKGSRGRSRMKKILVGEDPSPSILLPELTPQAIPVPELATSPQPELQLIHAPEPAPTLAPTQKQQSTPVTTVEPQSINRDPVFPALDHSNSLPRISQPTPAKVLEQMLANPIFIIPTSPKSNTEKRKNSRSRSGSKRQVTKRDGTEMSSPLQTQESPAEDQLPAAEAVSTSSDELCRRSRTRKRTERWVPEYTPSRSKSRSKVTGRKTPVGPTESSKQPTRRGWKSKSPAPRSKSTPPPFIQSAPEVPLAVAPAPKLHATMETPPDTKTPPRVSQRSGRIIKAPQRWEPEPIRGRNQSSRKTKSVSRGRRAKSVGPSNQFPEDSFTPKPRSRSAGSEPKSKIPETQSIPSPMPRRGRKAKSVGPTDATPETNLPPRSRSTPPEPKKLVVKLQRCDDIWATMTPSTGTSRILVQLPNMQQLQKAILPEIRDSAVEPPEEPTYGPELPALVTAIPTPAPLRTLRSRSQGSASNRSTPVKSSGPCVTTTPILTPKRSSRKNETPRPKKTTRSRTPKPKPTRPLLHEDIVLSPEALAALKRRESKIWSATPIIDK